MLCVEVSAKKVNIFCRIKKSRYICAILKIQVMLSAYLQFAVYGGGIGNNPALYLYSVGHLKTAFLYPTYTSYDDHQEPGRNLARYVGQI